MTTLLLNPLLSRAEHDLRDGGAVVGDRHDGHLLRLAAGRGAGHALTPLDEADAAEGREPLCDRVDRGSEDGVGLALVGDDPLDGLGGAGGGGWRAGAASRRWSCSKARWTPRVGAKADT